MKIPNPIVECFRCKTQTDERTAFFTQNRDAICDCGQIYTIIPQWRHIRHPIKVELVKLCKNCSMELRELQEKAFEKIIKDFIQPERSKREDSSDGDAVL